MLAAQLTKYGGQDAIKVQEVDKPSLVAGQVLVKVHAAALNPFDWKVKEGLVQEFIKLELPATLGGDFAGTITEIGEDVEDWQVGQSVFGQANAVGGSGSWAEFSPVKATSITLKPDSVDISEAAGASLAGISAYQAIVETIQLQPGQKILIHGGAGGIGTVAIQLAKHLGASVATTVSANDIEYVKSLGADIAIDYRTQDFSQILNGYDSVYDMVGGTTLSKSYRVLKPGGLLVSMIEKPDESAAKKHSLQASFQSSRPTPERLQAVAKLLESGAIKINVDKIFPLSQAADALEYLHVGSPRGKVIMQIM